MKHKDGSTDKHKDKHKEKRKEEKVIKGKRRTKLDTFGFCFFSDHELYNSFFMKKTKAKCIFCPLSDEVL